MKRAIYTLGHSTRSFEDLVLLLKKYEITSLVDVRTMPRSRTNPQFNQTSLEKTLPEKDIAYQHIEKLGGLRSAKKDSVNQGWRNKSFRGYADYMQTEEFQEGLVELIDIATKQTTAIMCAEAVPWRCHRSMIGDALLVRGYVVHDIFDINNVRPEKITSFAVVKGSDITYPNDQPQNIQN